MNFNIYNSLILAGVIQGIIFTLVVLLTKRYKSKSVYFLAALILTYSFSNLQYYLQDIRYVDYTELFSTFYVPWSDLTPALLYCYVISYLYPSRKITKKELLFFSLFVFTFIISTIYKISVRIEPKSETLENITLHLRYYIAYYADLIAATFSIITLVIVFTIINKYIKETAEFKYNFVKLQLNWLKKTLYILMVLIAIWVLLVVMDMISLDDVSFYPIWLGIAILIYWLGHVGIYKYGIDEERQKIQQKRKSKKQLLVKNKTKHIIIERLKLYLVDEKRFLDSSLTLEKTAQALELSQGHLSKIINTELQISFSDYINSLRVEEAKSYLEDSEFSNYTLVAIGLEAGFNSKSAFNASFKKHTGKTPSEYKQQHVK
ncbi:helix-turn-helix domain-containing protein [Lacinutrix iliipiscaria]|uniref:Helix-turn-helix domain-containing protein n=1 Tax=Lacinutrix iliipiscaria TaxID=1230532 RepID=A0ABW5WPL0_9FLAO